MEETEVTGLPNESTVPNTLTTESFDIKSWTNRQTNNAFASELSSQKAAAAAPESGQQQKKASGDNLTIKLPQLSQNKLQKVNNDINTALMK